MSDMQDRGRGRRGAGRAARRAARAKPTLAQNPYITRKLPIYEVLGEDGLELLEDNAETILQEIGIEFREDPEALQILKDAGADVDGNAYGFLVVCVAI